MNGTVKQVANGLRWNNAVYQASGGRFNRNRRVNNIDMNGMYEGSLFIGTRFQDSTAVDSLLSSGDITPNDIVDADPYVKEHLSYILHGDYGHYQGLKRLKNRDIRGKFKLKNLPYFIESSYSGLISQYRMSSGECLLVSLLHFIHNAIIRKSLPINRPIVMLLDEIELALHPVAVTRFIDMIDEIISKYDNVVVVLTSHAPEVIRRIKPRNLYKLENNNGEITYVSPCYPSYAIRELYEHDRYDYLLLCEDELAKCLVRSILGKQNLQTSKLVGVIPVGGWQNVLKLHRELAANSVIGPGCRIVSVLDGDIKADCSKSKVFQDLTKLFIPIASIEKYLFSILYLKENMDLRKRIIDKYFQLKSLDTLELSSTLRALKRQGHRGKRRKYSKRIRHTIHS